MGLDMSIYKSPITKKAELILALDNTSRKEEVAYWRKFYKLNDILMELTSADNCEEKELTAIMIIKAIKNLSKDFEEDNYCSKEDCDEAIGTLNNLLNTDFKNYKLEYHPWW